MDKREEIKPLDITNTKVPNFSTEAVELQKIFHKGYDTYWKETQAIMEFLTNFSDRQKQKIIDELPKPYDILSKAEELNRIEFKEWWHCLITKIKEL